MKIVELAPQAFDEFARSNPLNNYLQTTKYAIFMSNYGYKYDYIGFQDDLGNIKAASLILTKAIKGTTKYGYAPKGFLINYFDNALLVDFLNQIRKYYKRKNFVFVKFNPEIIVGETDKARNYQLSYNGNTRIIDDLKGLGIKKRAELQEFDLMEPRYSCYINLKNYSFQKLNRSYRKKIRHAANKGMSLVLGGAKDIDTLYEMMKGKTYKPLSWYRDFYNVFSKDNSVDLIFIKINYQKYLEYVRSQYDRELQINDYWNNLIQTQPKRKNMNAKMNSDQKLQGYKDDIIKATEGLKTAPEAVVAGALVVKHFNRISVVASGFSAMHKDLNPNHFLYFSILERYKNYFTFCDIGGHSGNFDSLSPYRGINRFKEKWDPTIFEFAGEFDLICSEYSFKQLIKTNFIENEFNNHPDQKE